MLVLTRILLPINQIKQKSCYIYMKGKKDCWTTLNNENLCSNETFENIVFKWNIWKH